jgi:hypothetical protein
MEKRNKVYKVRLSDTELQKLRRGNVENVARFLRESAIATIGGRKQKQVYTKLDREFLLELSRIGNNINQVAKALNTDLAKGEPFDTVRLFHLLIAINGNLNGLREDLK